VTVAAVPTTRIARLTLPCSDRIALKRVVATASFIVVVMALAFGVRAAGLSTYGFSEDEIQKVRAIEQYRYGRLSANAEHPMLMKIAMMASVDLASAWNRVVPAEESIAVEIAVRLPNAVVGAATTATLFGVCQLLFGTPVAMMASLLWAIDVNAIAINRLGKEDTFALFFFLLAVWCYERAKRQGVDDPSRAQRWYTAGGASFGLMLASKYFLQYLGVYALFNLITDLNPGANRPDKLRYYGAMVVAFLVANVALFDPATWRYLLEYVYGATVAHHGYAFAGQLYANTALLPPNGVPATFYLRLLATKVPVVMLGALVPGLIESVRRLRERGFIFLHLWLGLFVIGYSLAAVKFMRYALPLFAGVDIVAAIGVVAGIRWLLRKSWLSPMTRRTVAAAALTVCISGPLLAQQDSAPFYSLFRNAIGDRLASAESMFPEETYDYGVREAVEAIADIAKPGTVIVSDAPGVVAYYLENMGRTDLRVRSLSAEGLAAHGEESFVIVQGEHLSFENREVVAHLKGATPWREFYASDAIAARVYCVSRS
jgi:dolichyl-phosphate-mannose-protein mannosyltransferase